MHRSLAKPAGQAPAAGLRPD